VRWYGEVASVRPSAPKTTGNVTEVTPDSVSLAAASTVNEPAFDA